MKKTSLITLLLLALPMLPAATHAQPSYPHKPITLIVPYAAGGSSDVRARQIAQKIAVYLGQAVIVDNKPGGNGNIGTAAIAKAAPDGYTIGIGNLAPMAVNKTLIPATTPFDPVRDFQPVILIEKGPLVLVVNGEKNVYPSLNDLAKRCAASPEKMSYASAGTGGSFHLAAELFNTAVRCQAVHVPYRGGGPAANDLLAGQVDYMFEMLPAALPYLQATPAKMRALAVAHDKRVPSLPLVPTFAELGLKELEVSNWFGIIAPKNTPPEIVNQLNQAINRALREPDLMQRITAPGNVIAGGSHQDFAKHIATESERWAQLIKTKNIQAQ